MKRGEIHKVLKPARGSTLSKGPWHAQGDGTIVAASGMFVCVLGCPEEPLSEQNVTDGASILALPELLGAANHLMGRGLFNAYEEDELGLAEAKAWMRRALSMTRGFRP